MKKLTESGFTIIELLIATLVFTTVLLIVTFSIVQISRTYLRGYVDSQTQNTSRSLMSNLVTAVQLSSKGAVFTPAQVYSGSNIYWFCINGNRYTYKTDQPPVASPSTPAFIEETDPTGDNCGCPSGLFVPGCSGGLYPGGGGQELLGSNMRLEMSAGTTILTKAANNYYQIQFTILYAGNTNSYSGVAPNQTCNSLNTGGAFCSKVTLSDSVTQRLF